MSDALVRLHDVSFGYGNRAVLERVNLEVRATERVALVGDNGAGKTSLLQLIVGLHQPSGGEITAFGRSRRSESDFREVRANAGLLFQDSDDQLFCPTVLEDVAFGPLNLGRSEAEAAMMAERTLAQLGLEKLSDRITHKLSGGEKRMVALAGVLAMEPQLLLMDEPTNGLDAKAEQRLLEHLEQLPLAMLFVSHDRRVVERLATRAVMLQDRTLCEAVMHDHPHVHTHSHLHIHASGVAADHDHQKTTPPHDDHHGTGNA
ncbi:energy-coupling factor ABC transporter ATP-binding protein [Aestuariirhabdus sp. LZHN29]|uniref:energy-coupling factor ABC transporter ATP-binding protein n=1 Tax=Aestuariirhabdus sp. LZHN29 TaxID=3417462 RepID=UPI003CECB97D